MKLTKPVQMPSSQPLVLAELADSTRAAAEAFIAAGTAANTVRSYQSALTYWSAWLRLRYRRSLGDGALPPEVAVQFIVDHLARPDTAGNWTYLMPPAVDARWWKPRSRASRGHCRSAQLAIAWQFWLNGIACDAGITPVRLLR